MEQTGLVLEGGGLRGTYTAGVLDVLMEHKVKIPYVIGVSAGVCNAMSYLSHQIGRSAAINIEHCDDKDYFGVRNIFRSGSIFNEDMLFRQMPETLYPFDYDAYNRSGMRLYAGVTDCVEGIPRYYEVRGDKKDLVIVKASSWLPYVSHMVRYDGKHLLDGGISDSIPIRKSIADGNSRNIVVLTQHQGYRKTPSKSTKLAKIKYRRYPRLVSLLENRHIDYNETVAFIERLAAEGKVFLIRPSRPLGLSRFERNAAHLKQAYELGKSDTESCLRDLSAFLGQDALPAEEQETVR